MTTTPKYRHIMLVGDIFYFTPYGLNEQELTAIREAFPEYHPPANGKKSAGAAVLAINALANLGYHITTTTFKSNSNQLVWMLEKTIENSST